MAYVFINNSSYTLWLHDQTFIIIMAHVYHASIAVTYLIVASCV